MVSTVAPSGTIVLETRYSVAGPLTKCVPIKKRVERSPHLSGRAGMEQVIGEKLNNSGEQIHLCNREPDRPQQAADPIIDAVELEMELLSYILRKFSKAPHLSMKYGMPEFF